MWETFMQTIIAGGGLDRAADDGRLFAPVPSKRVAHPALTLVDDDGGDAGNSDAADSGDGTGNPVTENSDATDSSDGTGRPDAATGADGRTPQPTPPTNPFEGIGDIKNDASTKLHVLINKF
jgi:hypothetical protein